MKMKKITALLLALVMVLALAACGNSDSSTAASDDSQTSQDTQTSDTPTQDEDKEDEEPAPVELDTENPFLIGHIADLTGNEASTGTLAQQAVDFAAELINANGGIAGREVVVKTVDAQSSPAIAADAARQLVEDEGVSVIVGPTQISHKLTVAPVVEELQVPAIYYNGTPTFLLGKYEYVLSSGGGTAQMPTAMADYLYNELGARTIYTITQEGTAGDNYVNPLIQNFEALGGKVVTDIRVPTDATDISSYLQQVGDADALVGWLSGTQGVGLWTSWYDTGLADKMPLYGAVHGGFTDFFIWKQLNATRSDVVDKALEWGVYAPINYAYSIDNDVNDAFVDAWKDENGSIPVGSNLPGAGYTALMLIKTAAESISGDITPEALYEALQTTSVDAAEGTTSFTTDSRAAVKDVYIVKVVKVDDSFNYEVVDTYEDVPVDGLTVG
jgi:ABC-type branched-subunit amino acid transport system substrate-binding protein